MPGLLLQPLCFRFLHGLQAPSVLAAGKWRSWIEILAFIGSTLTCLLTTPMKSHPHKFYLFFAMPSALAKFAKVKFTQTIIALRYYSINLHVLQLCTAGSIQCTIILDPDLLVWTPGAPWNSPWKFTIRMYICCHGDAHTAMETFMKVWRAH